MYRIVLDRTRIFAPDVPLEWVDFPTDRRPIHTSDELLETLRERVDKACTGKKVGIALSGGIDSAILLQLVPDDAIAYTFKCVVPGVETTDESPRAAQYLAYTGKPLEHKIVPIYWEDMIELSDPLMIRKGAPIHSIEVQICKAAQQARADGCDIFVFGETADCIYGGHSQLLSRDWTFGDFVERWSFVQPYKVLRNYVEDLSIYRDYVQEDGYIDVLPFLSFFESEASLNSYMNACGLAGMAFEAPYSHTVMADPLDLERVRRGENKYLVREVFHKLYPGFEVPPKTPMPRPMDQWLANWEGPTRPEFWPHCTDDMKADQKWLVFSLERFLNLVDPIDG